MYKVIIFISKEVRREDIENQKVIEMIDEKIIQRTANTLNIDINTLKSRTDEILLAQGEGWKNAGKSEQDCYALALKVAGSKIKNENSRLLRSGASKLEGMFISVPRPKEWGKILYNKMKSQMMNASEEVRQQFVDNGKIVLYNDNGDGTYTRYAREDFFGEDTANVNELDKNAMRLDGDSYFYCVWDSNNPTFPSGDKNFKFGNARPQNEQERTSMFLGRVAGSTDDVKIISVTAQGKAADMQYPTFTPLTMALRLGKDGTRAYVKADMATYTEDSSKAEIFSAAPIMSDGTGLVPSLLGSENMLSSLDALRDYYDTFNGKDGWWDRMVGVVGEVIHIDPRENGGFTLVCADLDIASVAPVVEVYVPSEHGSRVDFAVGTKILLVGQTWRTNDTDEQKLSVSGWYPFDEVEAMEAVDAEGWD